MSQKCAVRDCVNTSEAAFMYDFPKTDKKLENAWIAFCDRGDYWTPNRNSQICSIHFARSEFRLSSMWKQWRRPLLKVNACPTVKLARKPEILGCDVVGCQNNETNLKSGVLLYDFPTDTETREKWIKFCGKPNDWQPYDCSKVCSEHFDSDAANNKSTRNSLPLTLKDKAYPTLKGPVEQSSTAEPEKSSTAEQPEKSSTAEQPEKSSTAAEPEKPSTVEMSVTTASEETLKKDEKLADTSPVKNTSIPRRSNKMKAQKRNEKKRFIRRRLQTLSQMGEKLNKPVESDENHKKDEKYSKLHYRCAVRDCEHSVAKPVRDVALFPFPDDQTLRQRWVTFCQQETNWLPESGDFVCYKHFNPVHFVKNPVYKKLVLRKCAIPTICSDGSVYDIETQLLNAKQSNKRHDTSSTLDREQTQPNSMNLHSSGKEQSEILSRGSEISLSGNATPTPTAKRTQNRSSFDKSGNSRSKSSTITSGDASQMSSGLNDENVFFPMRTDKNDSRENTSQENKSSNVVRTSNAHRERGHRNPKKRSSGGLFFSDSEQTEEPTGTSPEFRKSVESQMSLLPHEGNLIRKNAIVSLRNIAKDANVLTEKGKHGNNVEATSIANNPNTHEHRRSRSNTPMRVERQQSLDKFLTHRHIETSTQKNTDESIKTSNSQETNFNLHKQEEILTSDADITTSIKISDSTSAPTSQDVVLRKLVSSRFRSRTSKTPSQERKKASPSKDAVSSSTNLPKSLSTGSSDEPQMANTVQHQPRVDEKCFKAPEHILRRSRSDNTDKAMGENRIRLSSNSPCLGENIRTSKDSIDASDTDSQRSRRSRQRSTSVGRDQLALSLTNRGPFYIDDTRRESSLSPECILPEDEPRQLFFHKEHEKLCNTLSVQRQSAETTEKTTKPYLNPSWSTNSTQNIQHHSPTGGEMWGGNNLKEPLTPSFRERQKMVAEILNNSSSKCEVAKVLVLSPVRNKEPSPEKTVDIEAELGDMQDGSFYVDEEQAQLFFDGSPPTFNGEPINIFGTSVEFEVDDTTEYNHDEEPASPVQPQTQPVTEIKPPVRKEIKSPVRKKMMTKPHKEIIKKSSKEIRGKQKSVTAPNIRQNKNTRQMLQKNKRRPTITGQRNRFGQTIRSRDDKNRAIGMPEERELLKPPVKTASSIAARRGLKKGLSPVAEKRFITSTEASSEGKNTRPIKRARPVSPSDKVNSPKKTAKKSPVKTVKTSQSISKKSLLFEDQEPDVPEDMDVDIKEEIYDGLKTRSATKEPSAKKPAIEWQQCEVLKCTNNILNSAGIVSFHCFPLNPERRSQWIEFCKRPADWTPQNFSRICNKHFRTEDYAKVRLYDSVKKVLKIDAAPSIYIESTENVVDEDVQETFFSMFESSQEENVSDTPSKPPERQTSPKKMSPNKKQARKAAEMKKQQMYQDSDDSDESSSYMGENIKEEDSDSCFEPMQQNVRRPRQSPPPSPTSSSESSEHYLDETRKLKQKIEEQEQLIEELTKTNDTNEEKLKKQAEQIIDLNIQFDAAQEAKRRLCQTVDELETSLKKLRAEKQTYQADAFRNHLMNSQFGKILSQNQIDLVLQTKKKVAWTKSELKSAFNLRYFSKNLYFYNYLRQIYPLPKTTSIQKYAQQIDLHGGILLDILDIMGTFGKTLSAKDRATVLTYDRMPIKSAVEYNPEHDEILGPCNQVYIVVARGLFSDWKQPVYVDFQKKVSAAVVKSIVENLHKISFEVVALVNDSSEDKLKLFLDLGVSGKSPFFAHPITNKKICCFFDSPRLLENLRRTLVTVGFTFVDGTILTKEPLRKLLQSGSCTAADGSLYSASNSILNVSSSFTNSNPAIQLFSKTTVSLLRKSSERNDLVLAQFVETVYKWFQIMSSTNLEGSAQLSVPYRGTSDQTSALNTAFDVIKSTRCLDTNRMKVFQEAILISIRALQLFSQEMFKSYGEKSILACKLNQYTIDVLFNQIRDDCDLNEDESPTPLNLLDKMRAIVLGLSHEPIDLEPILFTITESYITRTVFEESQVKPSIREKPFDQILFASTLSMNPEITAKHIEEKCKLAKLIEFIKAQYRQKYADSDDDLPPKVKLTTIGRGCGSVQSSTSYADQMKNYCWLLEKIFRKTNKDNKFAYKTNVLETLADQAKTKTHVHLDVIKSFLTQRILIRAVYMNMKLSEKS